MTLVHCAAWNCQSALQMHLQRAMQLNDFFSHPHAFPHTRSQPHFINSWQAMLTSGPVIHTGSNVWFCFSMYVHKDLELSFPPYEQMPLCLPGIKLVYICICSASHRGYGSIGGATEDNNQHHWCNIISLQSFVLDRLGCSQAGDFQLTSARHH